MKLKTHRLPVVDVSIKDRSPFWYIMVLGRLHLSAGFQNETIACRMRADEKDLEPESQPVIFPRVACNNSTLRVKKDCKIQRIVKTVRLR
jgi:hypothetical protein